MAKGTPLSTRHGDFAVNNMKFIPGARIQDVVYFNPADTANPPGLTRLKLPTLTKTNISSEVIGVIKECSAKVSPRLEYILRYTILALLDQFNTTMLDITRMLTDKKFRKEVLATCTTTPWYCGSGTGVCQLER